MIKTVRRIIGCLGLYLLTSPAYAVLLVQDDIDFGAGSITFDSDSSLEWLDLTHSTGLSYNALLPQLSSGGIFDDFRLATSAEVIGLWTNAGIPLINSVASAADSANVTPVQTLINDFIGATSFQNTNPEALGITADFNSPTSVDRAALDFYTVNGVLDAYQATTTGAQGVTASFPTFGAWLVRESTVPEPSSIALLAIGLIGIAFGRKKKTT